MNDLAAFLEARLAEEHAALTAASQGPWRVGTHVHRTLYRHSTPGMAKSGELFGVMDHPEDAAHIVRFADPARVLAEIEAKQRRLTLYRESIKSLTNAYDKMQVATDEPTRRATLSRYETAVGFHSAAAQAIYTDVFAYEGLGGFDPTWKELIKYPDSGESWRT